MDTIFELIEKRSDFILKLHHKFALNNGFKLWRALSVVSFVPKQRYTALEQLIVEFPTNFSQL